MSDLIAGSYMAFAKGGEGDEIANHPVLIEVTNFQKGGDIELAFTATHLKDMPRIYLKASLPEVIAKAMERYAEES